MPLSRLENFLKNVQGNVIYVNPLELDATDDISNTGNSRARPFKTIQRALIESARFSYQIGKDNDKFDKTTILVSPGVHYIDNRPGYAIDTSGNITDVNGTVKTIDQFSAGTNFDINNPNNVLHHFNSVDGGVILPRGTSIVGQDLRKTKIRPKFVPNPLNDSIKPSTIFRVTGACWFFGFTFFDGDPNDRVYKDYTVSTFKPDFSHHKLTCFRYADGVNEITGKGNTDLDMYYYKLTQAYGASSGRALPNYPANTDFEKTIDECRIVGAISQIGDIQITDLYSGLNPTDPTATSIVTVETSTPHQLEVATPILIFGVDNAEYDGSFLVTSVPSSTKFTYALSNPPVSTSTPSLVGKQAFVTIESDSVQSASPYIFNCSVRSVFGLSGMDCDGDKATGFKSMVVAQFTGVSLNKDDDAYVKYNPTTGVWEDQATLGTSVSLHTDSLARHKPDWENFHVRVANNAIIQAVSVFAIGYAQHFLSEAGGDMSITNSNSNFGAKSFESDGFRPEAFTKDDTAYITSIKPPERISKNDQTINFKSIATVKTATASTDTKLYIDGFEQITNVPETTINKYKLGAKVGDKISVNIESLVYDADILMPVPFNDPDRRVSAIKEIKVGRTSGINSITGNTFTLQEEHSFLPGESIRIISDDGSLPDGLDHNRLYYAITDSLNADQIRIATTETNALSNASLVGINNIGGSLRIISAVSDKVAGDPGHPVQFDADGWYVNVGAGNSLRAAIVSNQGSLVPKTRVSTLTRKPDTRLNRNKVYMPRLVIPKSTPLASPPQNGFTLQQTGSIIDDTNYQNDNTSLTSELDMRADGAIINASWSSNVGVVTCQNPHRLKVGHQVQVYRLKSDNNESGTDNTGFNGKFNVLGVTDSKTFTIGINTDPGGISTITGTTPYTRNDASIVGSGRTSIPYFVKRGVDNDFQIFNAYDIQEYKKDIQDGVYDLLLKGYVAQPEVTPFNVDNNKFSVKTGYLFPRIDRDNPVDDPAPTKSYAQRDDIGVVEPSDPKNSTSRENIESLIEELGVGIGITGASVSGTDLTINTLVDHNLNGIKAFTLSSNGSNLGSGSGITENYFNVQLEGGAGKGATANVTINASGQVASVSIVDHGSNYSINDILTIRGIPDQGSPTEASITVSEIDNRIGDVVQIVGVGSESYNGLFKITAIPSSKEITYTGDAVDAVAQSGGYVYHAGISTGVTSIACDALTGIATVIIEKDLGFDKGDFIVIEGCTGDSAVYNGTHYIQDRIGTGQELSVFVGFPGVIPAPAMAGTVSAYSDGIARRGEDRLVHIYGGAHTYLNTSGFTATSTTIALEDSSMINRGDFLLIGDEIIRVSNTNATTVIRGAMGTNAVAHDNGVAVKKIKVIPTETRRYSILRGSGHTFEYVGFGPGNYSTAMPQTQDRILTDEQKLLSQSVQTRGGLVAYTGMDDVGDYYIGQTRIDVSTGEVEFLGGDETFIEEEEVATFLELDELIVNNNLYSNGNTEVIDILLRGNRGGNLGASVYVGISQNTPPESDGQNNILFKVTPTSGSNAGWVKTSTGWRRFAPVSQSLYSDSYKFDDLNAGISTFTNVDVTTLDSTGAVDVGTTLNVGSNITGGGNITVTGDVNANDGDFSGNIDAVDGDFTGDITAVDGTFSGALSALSATITNAITAGSAAITGALSAGSATISGAISAASGSISGALSSGSMSTGALTASSLNNHNIPGGSDTLARISDIPSELEGDGTTIVVTGGQISIPNNFLGSEHISGQSGNAPVFGVRAFGRITGNSGSLSYGQNVASSARTGTGTYRVTLSNGPGNNDFTVIATAEGDDDMIYITDRSTNQFTVQIRSDGGDKQNNAFHFMVIF
tara:strand:+ start:1860 stop:7418 length:5559 start_codon:yes stop_codon:yes gene_type:complete